MSCLQVRFSWFCGSVCAHPLLCWSLQKKQSTPPCTSQLTVGPSLFLTCQNVRTGSKPISNLSKCPDVLRMPGLISGLFILSSTGHGFWYQCTLVENSPKYNLAFLSSFLTGAVHVDYSLLFVLTM